MTVDVVCADPVFLDLTFAGLPGLPPSGGELFADDLHLSPGGAAITAIGLARLGLRAAVTAALGSDVAGRTLRELLEAEGVTCAAGEAARTPVTVVLPFAGDRAMVSYAPPPEVDRGALERLGPRAVVVALDRLEAVPAGPLVYAVVADPQAHRLAGALPRGLAAARALLANRSEAERLTGRPDPEEAALALAAHVPTAVVTCGPDGAVAASDGSVHSATAPPVEAVDTTGAGDLFTAAYVWGDLAGLPLEERLRRAVAYASLSVRVPTAAAGAAYEA
ncbi:MAG TPA: PfkB family carbohydrate kinase [Gaiellaceae bacterium]|nr:PfkB family carbohydrate kinase [Gaiellaceae bacterium]